MINSKKTYYSIREVCEKTGLEPHVLRYWESEFPQLHPKKNRAGNRAYRDKDIEVVQYIRHLLYEEQYTIPGAKKKLLDWKEGDDGQQEPSPGATAAKMTSRQAVKELKQVLSILKDA